MPYCRNATIKRCGTKMRPIGDFRGRSDMVGEVYWSVWPCIQPQASRPMWISLVCPLQPMEIVVQECRQTTIKLRADGSVEHSFAGHHRLLQRLCIECITIVYAWRHKSARECCRWRRRFIVKWSVVTQEYQPAAQVFKVTPLKSHWHYSINHISYWHEYGKQNLLGTST